MPASSDTHLFSGSPQKISESAPVKTPSCWIIVPAAGIGSRMNASLPKQYLPLAGKTVLEWTLGQLLQVPQVKGLVIALRDDDPVWADLSLARDSRIRRVSGGEERNLSVINALDALRDEAGPDDWVLVHDAARPCVSLADIAGLRRCLEGNPLGGILATPVSDTLKKIRHRQYITATLDRTCLWQAQTPQQFRYGILAECLKKALSEGKTVTDESSAVEHYGYQPLIVEGRRDNLKITRPEDLALAEWILQQQEKDQ